MLSFYLHTPLMHFDLASTFLIMRLSCLFPGFFVSSPLNQILPEWVKYPVLLDLGIVPVPSLHPDCICLDCFPPPLCLFFYFLLSSRNGLLGFGFCLLFYLIIGKVFFLLRELYAPRFLILVVADLQLVFYMFVHSTGSVPAKLRAVCGSQSSYPLPSYHFALSSFFSFPFSPLDRRATSEFILRGCCSLFLSYLLV